MLLIEEFRCVILQDFPSDNTPSKLWLSLLVWSLFVAISFLWLLNYKGGAGAVSDPQKLLPLNAGIVNTAQKSLYVFLHPNCSCSTATVNELKRLLHSIEVKPLVNIYFADVGDKEGIQQSSLWNSVSSIDGVKLLIDDDNEVIDLMGQKTSGNIVLYDEMGHLKFNGGITSSRGHEGDSKGKLKLQALLRGENENAITINTYGCGLVGGS